MGQNPQPLAQQRVDLGGPETVADRLQPVHIVDGGEPVVQRGEPDPGLGGLAFGPLVAVDAQLGGVGEVGAELDEERAEILIDQGLYPVRAEAPLTPSASMPSGWGEARL